MPNDKFAEARRGKDQSLGVAWNKLGCARLRNENPDEAEPCFQKSIDALGALEGASRISISMPLINIASAHWLQEKLDKAASTFEEALDVREREYGVNDRTSFVYALHPIPLFSLSSLTMRVLVPENSSLAMAM